MYETMLYWETLDDAGSAPHLRDFTALWRSASKVVYSRTLPEVSSARTQLERAFDPDAVRQMKAAAELDLSVGGADLAGQAMAAGLVDEVHLFLFPVAVGGGKAALPGHVRADLELLGMDRFGSGVVHVHYRVS
jgi:dihydrofolate reductase